MFPGWRRRSSVKYPRYSPSSTPGQRGRVRASTFSVLNEFLGQDTDSPRATPKGPGNSLHGTQDVETLCREGALSDFELCQALWAFRVISVVLRVDPPSDTQASAVDEGLSFILPEE